MLAACRAIAAAAAVLIALALPASAGAARSVPQGFYGVNWDYEISEPGVADSTLDTQFATMAAAGVETLRTNFYWAYAQPTEGAPFDHAQTDRIVRIAAAHGLEVLPVVIVAPAWARDSDHAFAPPRDPRQYAAYLTSLIGRYGPSGTFWNEHPELRKRPLRYWQIWNEPHLPFQWAVPRGTDPARAYGALLRTSYRAAKAADPGARVVLAGLANESWKYLSALYRKGRIRGSFDVAAMHPYTVYAGGVKILSERFRRVLRENRDARKPMWITELGLPAARGKTDSPNSLQTTDRGMAVFLQKSYAVIAANRRSSKSGVSRGYWYTWASSYCCDLFRYTGLFEYHWLDGGIEAKPAYRTYRASARRHEGCAKDATGACVR